MQTGNILRLALTLTVATVSACGRESTAPSGAAGVPAWLVGSSPPQLADAGAPLPDSVRVEVRDTFGNPVAGVLTRWEVTSGDGRLSSSQPRTDGQGRASVSWILGKKAGPQALRVRVGNLPPWTFATTARPHLVWTLPDPFGSGDTVSLWGAGLGAGTTIELTGSVVQPFVQSDTLTLFVAPDHLPACRSGLSVDLTLSAAGTTVTRSLPTLGSPLPVVLTPGQHQVLPELGAGCRARIQPGTYGVAVYRTLPADASPTLSYLMTATPSDDELSFAPVGAPPGTGAPLRVDRGPAALGLDSERAPDVVPPIGRGFRGARSAACVRKPLAVGETIPIADPTKPGLAGFTWLVTAVSTSAHYEVLARSNILQHLTPAARALVPTLADSLEVLAYPFLAELFGTLPDLDGNGRLEVVLDSSGSWPGTNLYRDGGCPEGDFVVGPAWDLELEGTTGYAEVVVHEAGHWIDLTITQQRPFWSVEGFAGLVTWYWDLHRKGIDFWAQDYDVGYRTPPIFFDGRYGGIGLGDHNHGVAILTYLVQQALPTGADPARALRQLLARHSNASIRPIFEQIGGSGRTEEELEGELILMHYADGNVAGTSKRLWHQTYDLMKAFSFFHLPILANQVDIVAPVRLRVPLARPDGVVVEIRARTATQIVVTQSQPGLALAIVRKQ